VISFAISSILWVLFAINRSADLRFLGLHGALFLPLDLLICEYNWVWLVGEGFASGWTLSRVCTSCVCKND